MQVKKIIIVGNSVALRNRPHVPYESKNYGQIIEEKLNTSEKLVLVNNLAFGRATMRDLYTKHDDIINSYGDLYIINIGVSDAATREVPRWYADVMNGNKLTIMKKVFNGFHAFFIKPIRPFLVLVRGKRSWTSEKKFKELYAKLIYLIKHNTNGRIICIGLNLPDVRVEKAVPGSLKKYKFYNSIIESICKEKKLAFLDVKDLDPTVFYPDGTHFSQEGNIEISNRLLTLIKDYKLLD